MAWRPEPKPARKCRLPAGEAAPRVDIRTALDLREPFKVSSGMIAIKDTDSDSGISSSSNGKPGGTSPSALKPPFAPAVTVASRSGGVTASSPTSTHEAMDDRRQNYTMWVREAIKAVTLGQKVAEKTVTGCSRLSIMLYVLSRHRPKEPITVINYKVRAALACLKRLGAVENHGSEEEEDSEFFGLRPHETGLQLHVEPGRWSNCPSADEEADEDKEVRFSPQIRDVKTTKKTDLDDSTSATISSSGNVRKLAQKSKTVNKRKVLATVKENQGKVLDQKKVVKARQMVKPKLRILTPQMAAICGRKRLTRNEVISRLLQYIRKKKLRDPNQRTVILCDSKLRAVTKRAKIDQSALRSVVALNLT